jgi:hypothetical protein
MGLLEEIDGGRLSARSGLLRKAVPGYDYRAREARAETDRKVRENLLQELRTAKRTLAEVSDELYRSGDREAVAEVKDVVDAIETVERRVDSASPGGKLDGLSGASEEELIRLIEYDASLIEDAEELGERARELRDVVETDDILAEVRRVRRTVRDIDRAFTGRRDHIGEIR